MKTNLVYLAGCLYANPFHFHAIVLARIIQERQTELGNVSFGPCNNFSSLLVFPSNKNSVDIVAIARLSVCVYNIELEARKSKTLNVS